jgi:hypothetical protein
MKTMVLTILVLLMLPAFAAETLKPAYHDCRLYEDIVNGRAIQQTICQDQDGKWVDVRPEKRKPQPQMPGAALTVPKAVKKPVYHNCRPFESVINGGTVRKTVCQDENGAWVEVR